MSEKALQMGVALVMGREVELWLTQSGYQWRGDDARTVATVAKCVPPTEYDEAGHPAAQLLERVARIFTAPTRKLWKPSDGNRQSLRHD
jgi:hypothetical protein